MVAMAGSSVEAKKRTPVATIARAILALGAFALLIAGNRAALRMNGAAKVATSWGDWLTFVGLFVLAGIAFGLAARIPTGWRYRPLRAVLLGIVPLLAILEIMLVAGPTQAVNFTQAHLGYLYDHPIHDLYNFGLWVLPVLLGVSIAAGFQSGD